MRTIEQGAAIATVASGAAVLWLLAAPPAWFGAPADFLLYQREGLAAGIVFRFVSGLFLVSAALYAARFRAVREAADDAAAFLDRFYQPAFAILTAGIFLSAIAAVPWAVCLNPDSATYLEFSPSRTAGYPLLLAALRPVGENFALLVPVQTAAIVAGAAMLAHRTGDLFGSRPLALALLAGGAGNVSLLGYGQAMLAEAPFAACLFFHLAAMAACFRDPSRKSAIAAGLWLGAAILFRPAGYAFLAALPFLILLFPKRRIAIASCAVLPALALLVAAAGANQMRYGVFSPQAFGGVSLFGHVAFLLRADTPSSEPALVKSIAETLGPQAEGLRRTAFPHEHWRATMNAYNEMLWPRALPLISAAAGRRAAADANEMARQAAVADLASALARATILADPGGYAAHVLSHYYGLWLSTFVPAGPLAARSASCQIASAAPPLDPALSDRAAAAADRVGPLDLFWALATLGQFPALAILLPGSLALCALVFWAHRFSPPLRFLIYAALGLQAYYAMLSGVQAAMPRYAAPLEPWSLAIVGGLALLAFQRRRRTWAAR